MSLLFYLTQEHGAMMPKEKIVEVSMKITKNYPGWYNLKLKGVAIINNYFNKTNQPVTGSHVFDSPLTNPYFDVVDYQSGWYEIQFLQFNPDITDSLEGLFQFIGTKMTGTFPPIWTYPKYQALSHAGCFSKCTRLDNYNEIPDDWK